MSAGGEVLVGIAIAFGLFGVVVQVLPGGLVVIAAIAVWAAVTGGAVAWTVLAVAVSAIVAAGVLKYLLAGRHLRRAGVPGATLAWGGLLGVIGFFVVPVVGLPLGFVLGVYAAQRVRLGEHAGAWTSTLAALRATGLTVLIELAGALVAAGAWLAAVVLWT